ncbi:heterokaryon incompatibility protein-domain-containing protein [Ilyonectria sp. MPI-CAGE-AT-0026]|nr:heterokaryon incompatibility protein-domain-containing protein [Ilyonectria sp. MPI-CAGE-AT-0026]
MSQFRHKFQYTDPPLRDREIRIFRLLPSPTAIVPAVPTSSTTNGIRGEIFTTPLENPCRFTALSYTWGDGAIKSDIELNGKLFTITSTLETALLGLRATSSLDLWIDQICINQEDDDEKGRQVPLMKDIYTASMQTIGWLWPPSRSTEKAIEYLERIGQSLVLLGFGRLTKEMQEQLLSDEDVERSGLVTVPESARGMKERIAEMIETEGEWHRLEVLDELQEFFDMEYFKRGWIKQEVTLPRNLVFRCRNHAIDGDVLYAALRFHTLHWQHASKMSREILKTPMTPETNDMMQALLQDRPGMDAANASLVQRAHSQLSEDEVADSLGNILQRFRSKRIYTSRDGERTMPIFSDGKDRIYGFLGLASDAGDLEIPIQYSKSVSLEAVYTDATKRIIANGDVDFLFLAHRTASHPTLPSWVPDFCSICDVPILTDRTIMSTKAFAAGIGRLQPTRTQASMGADSGVLVLDGIRIDVIDIVGSEWPTNSEGKRGFLEMFTPLLSIQLLVGESFNRVSQIPNHPLWATDEQKVRCVEAFWRVPIADQEYVGNTRWHSQRATAERSAVGGQEMCRVLELYHRLIIKNEPEDVVLPLDESEKRSLDGLEGEELASSRRKIQESKLGLNGELPLNYQASMSVLETRRGFLTSEGYVGIGPLEMQVGDVICVIFGAQLPLLLRPLGDNGYSFVGDVYCDGLMDGEALTWGKDAEQFLLR